MNTSTSTIVAPAPTKATGALNYLDFATAAPLAQAIKALLDIDESACPAGSPHRFMRLEQVSETHCRLTAMMQRSTWGSQLVPSSGLVGESRFLVDGADLKKLITVEPWLSNPLRIRPTPRNEIQLQCLADVGQGLGLDADLIDHNVSPVYAGSFDEFCPPRLGADAWRPGTIEVSDPMALRKRGAILNTFSKYSNDRNNRAVWFWFNPATQTLQLFGSEHSGADSGVALIKVAVDARCSIEEPEGVRFGVPARHLSRILNLAGPEAAPLCIRLSHCGQHVQMWSGSSWLLLPSTDPILSQALSAYAPVVLNNALDTLTQTSTRTFGARQLVHKVGMQKRRAPNDPEGVLLECPTDAHLEISKAADLLRRERSFAVFAHLTGDETPWQPVVPYHSYLMSAIVAAYQFCQQLSESELFVESATDGSHDASLLPPGQLFPETEDELMLWDTDDASTANLEAEHLVSLTQAYCPNRDLWTLFVDTVPYSTDFCVALSCATTATHDQTI